MNFARPHRMRKMRGVRRDATESSKRIIISQKKRKKAIIEES